MASRPPSLRRRTTARTGVTTSIRSPKLDAQGPGGTPTLQLKPVELAAIAEGTYASDPRMHVPASNARPTTQARPIDLPHGNTPTVALGQVEIDALLHDRERAGATPDDATTRPTIESSRLAMGSASVPRATATASNHPRGPRRARETLRADQIRTEPQPPLVEPPLAVPPPVPPRKR